MNKQKLNKRENTVNPNKTKGQIDCLVMLFIVDIGEKL